MTKKILNTKLVFLCSALLFLGTCNAENRDLSKLDETFTQFLKEQEAPEDAKPKECRKCPCGDEDPVKKPLSEEGKPTEKRNKVVSNEDPAKKDVPEEGKPTEKGNKVVSSEDPAKRNVPEEGKPTESKLFACGEEKPPEN